jgi:hypothetical protein
MVFQPIDKSKVLKRGGTKRQEAPEADAPKIASEPVFVVYDMSDSARRRLKQNKSAISKKTSDLAAVFKQKYLQDTGNGTNMTVLGISGQFVVTSSDLQLVEKLPVKFRSFTRNTAQKEERKRALNS